MALTKTDQATIAKIAAEAAAAAVATMVAGSPAPKARKSTSKSKTASKSKTKAAKGAFAKIRATEPGDNGRSKMSLRRVGVKASDGGTMLDVWFDPAITSAAKLGEVLAGIRDGYPELFPGAE